MIEIPEKKQGSKIGKAGNKILAGFLLFVPREDCTFLAMGIAEGLRMVISGGAVAPHERLKIEEPKEQVEGERTAE